MSAIRRLLAVVAVDQIRSSPTVADIQAERATANGEVVLVCYREKHGGLCTTAANASDIQWSRLLPTDIVVGAVWREEPS